MKYFPPRKIKKACRSYLNNSSRKTKWLRYVCSQVKGYDYITIGTYYPAEGTYPKLRAIVEYMLMRCALDK